MLTPAADNVLLTRKHSTASALVSHQAATLAVLVLLLTLAP
jgi:hypothetical protein